MFNEATYVIYQGHLREVVGEFNDCLIVDNGVKLVLVPGCVYTVFNISGNVIND